MGSLKSLAKGFLVATALIWMFNVVALLVGGDAWLGLMYLLIMLIPASGIIILEFKNKNHEQKGMQNKWRNLLFSFQGVALSFWLFDVLTTFYAINIARTSIELNPQVGPGILGAATFYCPTLVFSYILLFRLREKISLYATLPLTILTLGMGVMNLVAGAQNFQVFVDTAALASGMRYGFLGLIVTVNLAVPLVLKRMAVSPKDSFNLKKA